MSALTKLHKLRALGWRNAVDAGRSRVLFRYGFAAERMGIHILPVHYYSPVPSVRELQKRQRWWADRLDLSTIDLSVDRQEAFLESIADRNDPGPDYDVVAARNPGEGMGAVDAELLYRVVRAQRPSLVVEVGSGTSTAYIASALRRNAEEGEPGRLVAIEPYRYQRLSELAAGVDLSIEAVPVQDVDTTTFETLGEGDVLFIDSSHVARTGSDVMMLVLQVLPRLRDGVLVHLHDIPFPFGVLHPADVLRHHLFWNEWALVLALLSDNPTFEVLSCNRYLHHEAPHVLEASLTTYELTSATPPSSLWLRRRTG